MASLLLVEDEEVIKDKLARNVPWRAYGFDRVAAVENGQEALALLTQERFDIMVTDIQMPRMNGIELIKEARKLDPMMKIIVISGYAEFEYAQESIKLNVSDYLLKPFASRRLLEVVLRVKEGAEREKAERSELESLRAHLRKNLSALREKLLMDILNHGFAGPENLEDLRYLGLGDLEGEICRVVVMEIPENYLRSAGEEEKYLLNMQFCRQVERLLTESAYRHLLLNNRRNTVTVIIINPDEELPMRLEEWLTQLRLALDRPVVIGVGHAYRGLDDLPVSYREACVALQYRYSHGPNRVFSVQDVNLDNPFYHKHFYHLHRHPIFDHLRTGTAQSVRADLAAFIEELRCSSINPESLRVIASNLIFMACIVVNELGYNPDEILGVDFSPSRDVNQAESLDELEEYLVVFFDRITGFIAKKRASRNQQLVDEIRRHVEENFATDINLSDLAKQYKISPGYLSLLFSERTGKSFVEYLTERRIRKAKELLRNTDLRVYEVAHAVGYNDPFYFSNCFKRLVGVTPTEFRDNPL